MALSSQNQTIVNAYKVALNNKEATSILIAGNNISARITNPLAVDEFTLISKIAITVKDYIDNYIKKGGKDPFEKWLRSTIPTYVTQWNNLYKQNPLFEEFRSLLLIVSPGIVSTTTGQWTLSSPLTSQRPSEFEAFDVGYIGAIKNADNLVLLGRTVRVLNIVRTANQFALSTTRTFTFNANRIDGKLDKLTVNVPTNIEVFFASSKNIITQNPDDTKIVLDKLTEQFNEGILKNTPSSDPVNIYHLFPFSPKLKLDDSDRKYQKYNYKIGFLDQESLAFLETETKISKDFLYDLECLWIEQENYPNELALSHVPLFSGWPKDVDGSYKDVIDDYYEDLWKSQISARFVFLVKDEILDNIIEFFSNTTPNSTPFRPVIDTEFKYNVAILPPGATRPSVIDQRLPLDITTSGVNTFDPTTFIANRNAIQTYGQLVDFDYQKENPTSTLNRTDLLNWLRLVVIPTLSTREIYRKRPNITDENLINNIVSSQIFTQIWDINFRRNKIEIVTNNDEHTNISSLIENGLMELEKLDVRWKTINILVLNLLKRYIDFTKFRGYPPIIGFPAGFMADYDRFGIIEGFRYVNDPINDVGTNNLKPPVIEPGPIIDLDISEDWFPDPPYIFKGISKSNDYFKSIKLLKTRGLFRCAGEKISTFYTGSTSVSHSKYFIPVYDTPPTNSNAYHRFDLAFGHVDGSGSSYIVDDIDILPSKSIYRRYMLEYMGTTEGKFKFKDGKTSDYIYVIEFNSEDIKDRIDPGNIQITFCPLSSSSNQLINTGSNFQVDYTNGKIYTLIDDSNDVDESESIVNYIQDHYYLISGSIQEGAYDDNNKEAWGIVFPKNGVIVLDGTMLDQSCSFNTVTASIDGDNSRKLLLSISGSCSPNPMRTTSGSWFGRSTEEYMRETYVCRVQANEFNYTNNYTYTKDSGSLKNFQILTPFTYITSVGLYNRTGDLVAVGNTHRPLRKDINTEYIFQVRVRLI